MCSASMSAKFSVFRLVNCNDRKNPPISSTDMIARWRPCGEGGGGRHQRGADQRIEAQHAAKAPAPKDGRGGELHRHRRRRQR